MCVFLQCLLMISADLSAVFSVLWNACPSRKSRVSKLCFSNSKLQYRHLNRHTHIHTQRQVFTL